MKYSIVLALLIIGCAGLLFTNCRREVQAVPKPRAYQRLDSYAGEMLPAKCSGVTFLVNSAAITQSRQKGWLDVLYPNYRASIHLSVSQPMNEVELSNALDNRAERVELNLAGRRADIDRFESVGGFSVSLMRCVEPSPIPYQFVAVGPNRQLLSGAVAISGNVEPADSLAPVLSRLRNDVQVMLNSLEIK